MSASEVRDEVEEMLKELDEAQLETVATSMSLTMKDGKKNKKEALRNLITRHLRSDELEDMLDEGLDVFQKLKTQLEGMVKPIAKIEDSTKVNEGSSGSKMGLLEQLLKLKEELDVEEKSRLGELLQVDTAGESKALLDQLLKLKTEDLVVEEGGKVPKKESN